MATDQFDVKEYWRRGTSHDTVDELVREMATDLGISGPKHSHDPKSAITHVLNVSRRNGTPYQPAHCACLSCSHGFPHFAGVAR